MKKTLSIILAVIFMFSAVSVMASAEDTATGTTTELVSIIFYVDAGDIGSDREYHKVQAVPGKNFTDRLVTGEEAIGDPTKAATETKEYIFKGWERYSLNEDGEYAGNGVVYKAGNIPMAKEGETEVYYVAVFAEEEIKENQTFWQFVQSIFARINAIFEYFAKVFEGVVDF